MFDEIYYVKDVWLLWMFGYEGMWGEGVDDVFFVW